jgi:cell pole-organizing protein PopZ
MEEILSSIRRIIADEDAHDDGAADDELGAAEARSDALDDDPHASGRAAEDDEDPEEDVLELTKVVRESGEVVELQSERSSPEPAIEEGERPEPVFADDSADQEIALAHHEPGGVVEDAPQIHAPQIKDKPVPSEQARNSELVSGSAATSTCPRSSSGWCRRRSTRFRAAPN